MCFERETFIIYSIYLKQKEMNQLENLTKRLEKVCPEAKIESGIFNNAGEIIIRLTLPDKIIECTNIKALEINVENLEQKARLKARPNG